MQSSETTCLAMDAWRGCRLISQTKHCWSIVIRLVSTVALRPSQRQDELNRGRDETKEGLNIHSALFWDT